MKWILVWLLAGAVAAFAVDPLDRDGNYVLEQDGVVRIGTAAWELQVDAAARPLALYDKISDRFVIADWQAGDGVWWHFADPERPEVAISNLNTVGSVALTETAAAFRYEYPANGTAMTVTVRPGEEGELRFRYELTNGFAKEIDFVFFPTLSGISKSTGGWAFQAWWNGIKRDIRDFSYLCYGGPGHLSMLVSALKAGDSTLLFYPQDPTGFIKFAIADDMRSGPDGVMILTWQNRDYIQPGETFVEPYDYTLFALGDAELPQVAAQYRRWAETQPWVVPYAEKLAKSPVIAKTHAGVIKMGGFEGVGDQCFVWADRAFKDANCKILTYNYPRFLSAAETIERLYDIKPAYRYDGWWGRFDSAYPDYFPVDPALGDFGDFIQANRDAGRLVYLHTNPIQYDEDAPSFDLAKMSRTENGEPCSAIWSRNRLFFASPLLALPDEVRAIRQIVDYGVEGIFEDVIGCTTMVDVNENAGYTGRVRDNGSRALLELCRALDQASPGTFRGTEGGEERRMPYYSAFMMGAGDTREVVPFWGMVYGDCVANATGIEGGTTNALERNRRMLFGQILGLDGRADWAREYDANVQMYFATQAVLAATLGQRISDFDDSGDVWMTQWPAATVMANLGEQPVAEYRRNGWTVRGMGPLGAALVTTDGNLAVWNCREVAYEGRVLFSIDAPDGFAVVKTADDTLVANLGTADWQVKSLEIAGVPLDGEVTLRPAGTRRNWSLPLVLPPNTVAVSEAR